MNDENLRTLVSLLIFIDGVRFIMFLMRWLTVFDKCVLLLVLKEFGGVPVGRGSTATLLP